MVLILLILFINTILIINTIRDSGSAPHFNRFGKYDRETKIVYYPTIKISSVHGN